jgi:hypothetical protein
LQQDATVKALTLQVTIAPKFIKHIRLQIQGYSLRRDVGVGGHGHAFLNGSLRFRTIAITPSPPRTVLA